MARIGDYIDALLGKKRWEDVTKGVFVSPAMGASAGCGVSYVGYVSPNYVEWDPGVRVNIGTYTLVDDGDDVYNDGKDYWESSEGSKVDPKGDENLIALLGSHGLDPRTMNGISISALKRFREVYSDNIDKIQTAKSGNAVWPLYQEIVAAASTARIDAGFDSPVYRGVLNLAGAKGCYIPMSMAEEEAAAGQLVAMRVRLSAALHCASREDLKDPKFNDRANTLTLKTYLAAIESIRSGPAARGDVKEAIAALKSLVERAKKDDVMEEITALMVEVAKFAFERAYELAVSDPTVRKEAAAGSVATLDAKIDAATKVAVAERALDDVASVERRARLSGYLNALAGIESNEAKAGSLEAMDKKLDALVASATEKRIINTVGAELRNVRIKGYLAAVRKVEAEEAARGDVKSADKKLDAIQQRAQSYRILSGFRSVIADVRRTAKNNVKKGK